MHSIQSLEIKYCLKGLEEGLVQTGTNWIFPCWFSKSEEARSLGKSGEEERGEGRKECGPSSPLEPLICLCGKDKCVLVCVYVCSV